MTYRLATIFGLGMVIVSCTFAQVPSRARAFLVVDGAVDLQEYQTEDGRHSQVTYSVVLKYPDLAIDKPQWEELKRQGWSRCEVKNPGWDNFPDIATVDGRTVQRHMSYWAKDNRLITISLNYYSALQVPSKYIEPDNSIQHVVILFDTYDDIRVIADRLEISCP